MRRTSNPLSKGNSGTIFSSLLGFSFFSMFLLTDNLVVKPLQSSDWNKINSIECKRQTNHNVVCKHNLVGIMGTGVKSKTFKLVKAEVKEYEDQSADGPYKAYELHLKTDGQEIEIKDYGVDYERAYSKKLLFDSLLSGNQEFFAFRYADGLMKNSIIGGSLLLTLILTPSVTVALHSCWYSRMKNTNSNF